MNFALNNTQVFICRELQQNQFSGPYNLISSSDFLFLLFFHALMDHSKSNNCNWYKPPSSMIGYLDLWKKPSIYLCFHFLHYRSVVRWQGKNDRRHFHQF